VNDASQISVAVAETHSEFPADWRRVRLGEVCLINPRRPVGLSRDADELTTFVPMSALDERLGIITQPESRPFAELQRGYTYFQAGDVLFAKITPCMQNGKHAIARDLTDDIGFASTEFHVVRPTPEILGGWVHYFLRQPSTLAAAERSFTGTAGQQRVPPEFLVGIEIPLPPLGEQKRIVAILNEQMAAVERARLAVEAQLRAARALLSTCLRTVFEKTQNGYTPKRLGELLQLRKEVVHPHDKPTGQARFVGLEHIESLTGVRTEFIEVDMSRLTGRKPRFYKGDIVYGYLRPYLNKVWLAEFDGLCSVDQYVFEVRSSLAEPEFIAWFMRSSVYLQRAPIQTTPGQLPRIRTEEVASVELHLPPIPEQRAICALINDQVTKINQLHTALGNQLAAINALPAAVLRRAFNGEL